ncbi:MAG TPA: hypothetical protein VIG32_06370 [Candidatus Baltobacteraceae bacterium]
MALLGLCNCGGGAGGGGAIPSGRVNVPAGNGPGAPGVAGAPSPSPGAPASPAPGAPPGAPPGSSPSASPSATPAPFVPLHVLTFLYYGQTFAGVQINANLSASYMAANADFAETSGYDNARTNSFKAAGGKYAVTYIDPTFVPYCVPPFTEPAGACAGQVGKLNPPAGAWFHDSSGARVNRADATTGQYQEALNPGSAAARNAVVATMSQFTNASPGLDLFFSDDSGSTFIGPNGTVASGMFYGFNASGVEITTDSQWISAESALLGAAVRPVILNGGDPSTLGPAYNGAFLDLANVRGANHEGCFTRGSGAVTDQNQHWQHQADGLLADLGHHKYSFCMMTGTSSPQTRLYGLASWWLTYDPQWSVAAPIAPAADGNAVYPEFAIVPRSPRTTASADVNALAKGGVYVREFAQCYQAAVPIGACAAVVNPSASGAAMPALSIAYTSALTLDNLSLPAGGSARWSTGVPGTLGPGQAIILRQ